MSVMKSLTIGGQTWQMPDVDSAILSILPTDTASGAIASFPDGYPTPVQALTVNITPVQDLHGYQNPWPAGGGDNIYPFMNKTDSSDYFGITSYSYINNHITIKGTATRNGGRTTMVSPFFHLEAGSYYVKQFNGDAHDKTTPSIMVQNGTTNLRGGNGTFTLDAASDNINIGLNVTSGAVYDFECDLMIVSGSTAPADFTPYANVCPITGHSQENIYCEASYDPAADPSVVVTFGTTVYGGSLDVLTGELTTTMANIASYAGETIGEPWLSSIDKYVPGATPTTGAQVVYTLTTATTSSVDPATITPLSGANNIWSSTGDTSVTYKANLQGYIDKKTGA